MATIKRYADDGTANDGIITLVESNGQKTTKYLPLEYLEYTNKIRKELMDKYGYINDVKLEIKLRDRAIKEFARKGMQIYGIDT